MTCLILGASARAAAISALRCRLVPRCADYFADLDLTAIAVADRIDPRDSTRGFEAWAESIPPSPWLYTGGLENHPDLVDRISAAIGSGASTARPCAGCAIRSRSRTSLPRRPYPGPEVRRRPDGLPRDGSWLSKAAQVGRRPRHRALDSRGRRPAAVALLSKNASTAPASRRFLSAIAPVRALIGATRQLIGFEGCPFGYRGSVGPWPIDASLAARLQAIGDLLASAFGLAGWFGVDYVLRDEIPWPVEINPRYTASVEVHELATGRALLPEHRRVCEGGTIEAALPGAVQDDSGGLGRQADRACAAAAACPGNLSGRK